MTCSKGPSGGIKPGATKVRTWPLYETPAPPTELLSTYKLYSRVPLSHIAPIVCAKLG